MVWELVQLLEGSVGIRRCCFASVQSSLLFPKYCEPVESGESE